MNISEPLSFNVTIFPFDKSIIAPRSKSHTNRALICAAFAQENVVIRDLSNSTDVTTLIDCLKKIGLVIKENGEECEIGNSFPECEVPSKEPIVLNTGDGGTTNRFLLALLSLGKNKYILKPEHGMKERPMDELFSALREFDISVERTGNEGEMSVQGPPPRKLPAIEMDCSRSSQFASAMMMSYPQGHFTFKNLKTSKKYLDLTNHVMREIAQKRQYDIPVDWSSLSYPIALATTLGKVVLTGVKYIDELQGDSILMKLLRDNGGKISMSPEGMVIEKADLKPFDLDCSHCPDLVPTLCYLASSIEGKSVLRNVKVLRHKESDRLKELFNLFSLFQIPYHYDEEGDILSIEKSEKIDTAIEYNAPADHRMIMVAYLFMRYHGAGTILNAQYVSKSFPGFFEQLS